MPKDVIKLEMNLIWLHKPLYWHKYMLMYMLRLLMIGILQHVIAVESAKFGLLEVQMWHISFQVMGNFRNFNVIATFRFMYKSQIH